MQFYFAVNVRMKKCEITSDQRDKMCVCATNIFHATCGASGRNNISHPKTVMLTPYFQIHKLCAHPWLAVHSGCTVHYMAPLARQNEFYVPEFTEDIANKEPQGTHNDLPTAAGNGRRRRQRPIHHYKLILHTPQTPVLRSQPQLGRSNEQFASRLYPNTRSVYTVRYGEKKKKTPELDDNASTTGCGSESSLAASCETMPAGQEVPLVDDQCSVPSDGQAVESDSDGWVNVETDDKCTSDNGVVDGRICWGAESSNGIVFQFSSDSGSDEEQAVPCIRPFGLGVIES